MYKYSKIFITASISLAIFGLIIWEIINQQLNQNDGQSVALVLIILSLICALIAWLITEHEVKRLEKKIPISRADINKAIDEMIEEKD